MDIRKEVQNRLRLGHSQEHAVRMAEDVMAGRFSFNETVTRQVMREMADVLIQTDLVLKQHPRVGPQEAEGNNDKVQKKIAV